MRRYLARRIGQSVVVLFGVTVVVFVLIHLVPGDPVRAGMGTQFDPAVWADLRHRSGLDRPLLVQYLTYIGHAVTGDLGVSFNSGLPVTQLLLERLPASLSLALTSLVIGLVIAFPLGVLAAVRRDSWVDGGVRLFSQLGISVPDFWTGILLILLLAGAGGVFPPSGYVPLSQDPGEWARHVALPGLSIGLVVAAINTMFVRSAVLEELGKDYVRAAEAKGIPPRLVVRRHVLRNALVPVVTVAGVQLAGLLGGVIVIEVLFAWPGLGLLTYQAVDQRDYAVLQGSVLLVAAIFLLVNLLVDLLYAVIDPRITLR
jgi:peptide/nickel transport system permease protein